MISTVIVRAEIKRFIKSQESQEPELIAIIDEWGVGKTYTWHTELTDARDNKECVRAVLICVALWHQFVRAIAIFKPRHRH
jgi:hypothetical protein